MNILLLGPYRKDLIDFLSSFGDKLTNTEAPLTGDSEYLFNNDFIVSYGYRYILKKDILNKFPNKAINLHISLLPWNRGVAPNLWSFWEDSPKGVTIHYLDYGIDTGDILAQQKVDYIPEDTLRTSYERLSKTIEELFRRVWPNIRSGKQESIPQPDGGSYHRLSDRAAFEYLLVKNWDTPVADLIGKAKRGSADEL
jgi:methionyl-tRNA formyltransferase